MNDRQLLLYLRSGTIRITSINEKRLDIAKVMYPESYKYIMNERAKNG